MITLAEQVAQLQLDCEKAKELVLEREHEIERLAYENKNMAEFIKFNDKSLDDEDVGDIATSTWASGIWDRYISVNSFKDGNDQLLLERGELINENYELKKRLQKVMNYANLFNEMEDLK